MKGTKIALSKGQKGGFKNTILLSYKIAKKILRKEHCNKMKIKILKYALD